jgi:midasin
LKKISSEKSLLWIHGGHPFLPTSSDLHDKNQQLLKLSEALCPRKRAHNSNQGLLLQSLLLVFFFVGKFGKYIENPINWINFSVGKMQEY